MTTFFAGETSVDLAGSSKGKVSSSQQSAPMRFGAPPLVLSANMCLAPSWMRPSQAKGWCCLVGTGFVCSTGPIPMPFPYESDAKSLNGAGAGDTAAGGRSHIGGLCQNGMEMRYDIPARSHRAYFAILAMCMSGTTQPLGFVPLLAIMKFAHLTGRLTEIAEP
ncbi:uncharacterized protein B0T23DRAFT_436211 [Neurospora hispaniola]|uniref:Uncharacterized protein n=1 Tax=Neurospora hispaniola TaxID=588809 RepID=A0AAJ0HYJ1_9PEZI|nr:hypothetical protein B0T23DRAFT_436211 [Neurospora hispaniola]